MYTTAVNDLMLLFLFLMIGVVLRQIIKPLRKLYLPSGLIGGAAALIMGPQVLNLFAMPDTWSSMASPMINIVLTTTLFGIAINKSKMKSYAGAISSNMLSYFSQMLVGILAGVGLQKIWKGLPESWGVMTVFTYWGRSWCGYIIRHAVRGIRCRGDAEYWPHPGNLRSDRCHGSGNVLG